MSTNKQTLKTTLTKKLLVGLGLVLCFSFFYAGTDTASAASKKAENACKNAAKNVENSKRFRDNISACYHGYDQVGDAQNAAKKCKNKYSPNIIETTICIVGSKLAKDAASKPPTIKRCDADDIDNKKQCKKDYRKCDSVKGKKAKADCKKDKVGKHIKPKKEKKGEITGIGDAGQFTCGTFINEDRNVKTRFDFGCLGTDFDKLAEGQKDASDIKNMSPILDLAFSFVRFLSIGVGIVMAASMRMSAIQYSMSEGNAEVTQKAKARIRSASMGFIIYIFAYAILQFVIPGGIFK